MISTATHDHRRGYQLRAFPGKTGLWVQRYGEWVRPVTVWQYRGAWRAVCYACSISIRSGNALYDNGWPTQTAAMDAANRHCNECEATP